MRVEQPSPASMRWTFEAWTVAVLGLAIPALIGWLAYVAL
jgi:hypothetical protein